MVAGLSVVLWLVVVSLVVNCVLVAESRVGGLIAVVSGLVVDVLDVLFVVSLMGDHSVIFVMDGTGVGFVLEFDMGLLLVVLLVVRVEVSGDFVMDGVLMDNLWLVVVLVVSQTLDEVVGLLVMVLVMTVLSVVVTVAIVVSQALIVMSVVAGVVMGGGVRVVDVLVVVVVSVVVDWGLNFVNVLVEDVGVVGSSVVLTAILVGVVGGVVLTLTVEVGIVAWGVVERLGLTMDGQVVTRDLVLHLAAKEDLGEGEADGVTILIEVLVLPLGLSVHDLVMDILTVNDQVMLNMEDEVPWVSEGLGHLAELVKIGADGGLALFELVGDIVNDVTKILNSVKHRVE